jgi:hypothetical protein
LIQVANAQGNRISATDLDECLRTIEERTGERFVEGQVVHAFGEGTSTLTINGLNVPYEEPSRISDNRKIKVVFFKETLTTGWDCPRAETMMSFRRAVDYTYIAQLLGRMIRTPLQQRVTVDETLNKVHLYLPQFDEIVAKFEFKTFADGELEKDDFMVLVDENTPEGFQIASNDKYEYRLYVPLTWTVQRRTYNPKAYFSTTDSSNVTMNMRVADEDIYDGKTYWEDYQKGTYLNLSEIVIDENAKLGQYPAYGVDYTCEISGVVYKIKQVFLTVNGNIYIFTYTSNRRNYEKHLEDVNKIIEMFEFKK